MIDQYHIFGTMTENTTNEDIKEDKEAFASVEAAIMPPDKSAQASYCVKTVQECEELFSMVTNSNLDSCLNHETLYLQTLYCCHKEVRLADCFLGPKERSF